MSKKANEELLNSLHFMTATELARLMSEAKKEGDNELLLRVIREAKSFLKDNAVTAEIGEGNSLRQIEEQIPRVEVSKLPFEVVKEE